MSSDSRTSTSKVNIVVGNINGKLSKGRGQRRDLIIAKVIQGAQEKPDFLAFQDGVQGIDVKSFIRALNEKWPDSYYQDVSVARRESHKQVESRRKQTGNPYSSYNTNKEALIYDANSWERRVTMEDMFYEEVTLKNLLAPLLTARCRLGIFEERSSGNTAVVVSVHGEQNSRSKKSLTFKDKEALLRVFLENLVSFIDFKMKSRTSLFVCGDFNFDLTRTGFMETLHSMEFEIFPKQQERKRPIDFVLVRGTHVNVQSCEQFHPSNAFRKSSTVEASVVKLEQTEERERQEARKLEEELRVFLASFPDSLRLKIKTEPETVAEIFATLAKEDEEDKFKVSVEEITSTDDGEEFQANFDHDFIFLSAELNCTVKEESPEPETSYDYKSPRPDTASVLILKSRAWKATHLYSEVTLEYKGIEYMYFPNQTIKDQRRLYQLVRNEKRKGEEGLIWFSS